MCVSDFQMFPQGLLGGQVQRLIGEAARQSEGRRYSGSIWAGPWGSGVAVAFPTTRALP